MNQFIPVLLVLACVPVHAASPAYFNVADYGAVRDGSAQSTDAFRKAIQAAKAAGGGRVFVPAGNYVTGPIEMISNMTLYIDAGATLRFPAAHLPLRTGASKESNASRRSRSSADATCMMSR